MRYKSTRGGQRGVPFERVLLSAYATDGGLYVPEELPRLSKATLASWAELDVGRVCARVLEIFTDLSLAECEAIAVPAFASFNDGATVALPLERVGGHTLLDASRGPTLAFKDVGQQVIGRLLNHYLGRRGARANIVVETSGDTGPAAIAGVRDCPYVSIFCLYPKGRTSEVQELQMITVDAPNVRVYRTEGDTDEQARALKLLFSDADFMSRHHVCSINSINWARILVQSSYYIWACLQLQPAASAAAPVAFVVPTGAFGNAVSGYLARLMGAPVGLLVCATNANDIVHRTLSLGDMSFGPNRETLSPAMDIQFAYNLERMIHFATGGSDTDVRRWRRPVRVFLGRRPMKNVIPGEFPRE